MFNPIQDWIDEDENLSELLVEIQSLDIPEREQARIAFKKLCEHYDLPQMPEDTLKYKKQYEELGITDPRSVFEEHALLKYFMPENDPRGLVLNATYHVKMDIRVDYQEIAEKEFGNNIPENLQIGIRGSDIDGEIVFPIKEGKSWVDLDCKVLVKI